MKIINSKDCDKKASRITEMKADNNECEKK